MADRNDELLLALGWICDPTTPSVHEWFDPNGDLKEIVTDLTLDSHLPWERSRPRPYDNLQDAVDCVPEGYTVMQFTCSKYSQASIYPVDDGKKDICARSVVLWPEEASIADTPADALSAAILKAVGNTRKEAGQ